MHQFLAIKGTLITEMAGEPRAPYRPYNCRAYRRAKGLKSQDGDDTEIEDRKRWLANCCDCKKTQNCKRQDKVFAGDAPKSTLNRPCSLYTAFDDDAATIADLKADQRIDAALDARIEARNG